MASSAYLSTLVTNYWDKVVAYATAQAIVESGFAPLMAVFDQRMGVPGAQTYDLEPIVMPGLPVERTSLYVEPTADYMRQLPRVSITMKPYAGKVPIALVEIYRLVRAAQGGDIEGLGPQPGFRILVELLSRCYQLAASNMAVALENPTATSTTSAIPFILAVANTAGTGSALAFASSKTLLTGGSFSNTTTGVPTHDKVAAMRKSLLGETDPNGIRTYCQGRKIVHGPYWDQAVDQIVRAPYTSGALQPAQGLYQDVPIPAMATTSTEFYLVKGGAPVSGGPTIVWSGAAASAEDMPPEVVGRDGKPRVSKPIWNEGAEMAEIYYRTCHGVGAAISAGWFRSSGA